VSEFAKYRAPLQNESYLCEPAASTWGTHAARSWERLYDKIRWSGLELNEIREETRHDAIRLSHCNTNSCTGLAHGGAKQSKRWYVGGHQPELFHPGVWFKNFILFEAAQRQGAVSLNVVIDHDSSSPVSLTVPSLKTSGELALQTIAVANTSSDLLIANVPWELTIDRGQMDWAKFEGEIVGLATRLGIEQPIISTIIPMIQRAVALGTPVGKAIAGARHQIERAWGIDNHEVLFSQLAQGRGFSAFVFEIISQLEGFREIYNSAREEYRQHHRIKNASQPIPKLATQRREQHEWLEAPFWVYRKSDPVRRALWVRYTGEEIIISDLQNWKSSIRYNADMNVVHAWWYELLDEQVAIRPRALTTTLFLRLAIADLFLHGIGGGKYDQITDMIIERWCRIETPPFAVATATLHLPIRPEQATSEQTISTRGIRERNRDYLFNPERLVSDSEDGEVQGYVLRHQELLKWIPQGAAKAAWHSLLRDNRSKIRALLPISESTLAEQLQYSVEEERQWKIRTSREFSMAIFPDSVTQQKLKELAAASWSGDNAKRKLEDEECVAVTQSANVPE